MRLKTFQRTVKDFYRAHGRHSLPWRQTRDPYKILVSEVMLQQTQVDRVIPKYKSFLKKFPTARRLAAASPRAVVAEWQGLGYNRRAVNLKRACEIVMKKYKGRFPSLYSELVELPGVGPATAGDLLAFAYNKPAVVIETNIRTVFIHHFFKNKKDVSDKEIATLVEATLPSPLLTSRRGAGGEVRDWYWALMDYGTHLKKTLGNNAAQSKHYKKQSKFTGSNRELRSKILKLILNKNRTEAEIIKLLDTPAEPVRKNLIALKDEGLLRKQGPKFTT